MPSQVVKPPTPRASRLGGRYGRNRPFTPIPPDPQPQPAPSNSRQTKCCDKPEYEVFEGAKICINCGTQISEQNIVAEVTFGETSTGAATVQGGFVGETARHAKTLGAAASRRIGGQYQSREETEQNGRSELRQLCPLLRISQNVEDVAFNLWKLAAAQNFIQGRRTPEVAGVCLYAACRREKQNTVLLMDISEALSVNVFRLGDIYKDLSKALFLEVHSHLQPVAEIEPLLMKYCSKLEFGDKTRQVAEDSARIVKRMKRDWMVTGRHPAGLCGACILLAARMNNFRRTVREIVYIVKVSEITIGSRLSEFKKTRSSTMSVDDFRAKSHRLKHQHDPPSLTAAEDRHKRLKLTMEKRVEREATRSREASMASRQSSTAPSEGSEQSGETQQQVLPTGNDSPRRDADGFAIPALPGSQPTVPEVSPKKRGRTKASDLPKITLTEADFALEHELEHDIEDILQDPNCVSARDDTEREKLTKRAEQLAEEQRTLSAAASAARQGLASSSSSKSALDDPEIGDWEFADDPEVQNALLPEAMVQIKETIWLRDNEDWLRAQQAKHLKAELERANGGRAGGDRKKKKRGARSRMGDGTVLTDGGTPVMSPADAAQRMLNKRGGKSISKAINYAMLNQVFGGDVGPTAAEKKRMARRAREGTAESGAVGKAAADEDDEDENAPEESWAGDSPPAVEEEEEDFERAAADITGDFGYGDYE